MHNLFKINGGTPWNTEEKKGVPVKKGSVCMCRLNTYIYGTPEHRNTTYDKSRMSFCFQFFKIIFLIFLIFLILKLLKPVFRCSSVPSFVKSLIIKDLIVFQWCSSGVPVVFQLGFQGEK